MTTRVAGHHPVAKPATPKLSAEDKKYATFISSATAKLKAAGIKATVGDGSSINEDQTIVLRNVVIQVGSNKDVEKAYHALTGKKAGGWGGAPSSIMDAKGGVNFVIGTKAGLED